MVTRDPFCHPWKRAERVMDEAIRRNFEVVIGLDERSCQDCLQEMFGQPVSIYPFTPPYDSCGPVLDEMVHKANDPTVLLVSDDEEPSPGLWDFATKPTIPDLSWTVRMLTPVPDGRLYELGTEIQIRVIAKDYWRWIGGISGYDEHAGRVGASQKILWHYALHASRDLREKKIPAYRLGSLQDPLTPEQWDKDWHTFTARHYWEDNPDAIVPMPADLAAQLPG